MENKYVSIEKMSKKKKKEYHSSKRNNWGTVNPCTKIVSDKTKYDRNKYKHTEMKQYACII